MNELETARLEIDRVDREIAALFERRMAAVEQVIAYKKQNCLPILDSGREAAVIEKNSTYITRPALLPYYRTFLQQMMDLSKEYQKTLL